MPLDNFRTIDRETAYLLPPSVNEWLPERHLDRFIVEGIGGWDLSAMSRSYRGTGSASYHPTLLLGLLVYGYATGVFSSRKLERATYDSVAFRFIAANDHPDHDTIATFRRRFLKEIERLFVQVLELAREMGMLTMAPLRWTAPRSTPTPAGTARCVRARRQDRGAIEGGSGRVVGAGGSRGHNGCARRHVDSRGIGTPRESLGEACRGPRQARSPRQGARAAREGRAGGQAGGAGGEDQA